MLVPLICGHEALNMFGFSEAFSRRWFEFSFPRKSEIWPKKIDLIIDEESNLTDRQVIEVNSWIDSHLPS